MKWFVVLLGLSAFVSAVHASATVQEEVQTLGRLNGQALACSQKENVSRIKAVMINHVPKSRQYGATFEQTTQEAFLERNTNPEACGDEPVITLQVEALASRLRAISAMEEKQK